MKRQEMDDLPRRQGKRRFPGSDRERQTLRRAGGASRIARPMVRFLLAQLGRPWRAVQAELDARLRRLPANRYLRQRVRRLLLQALNAASRSASPRSLEVWVNPANGTLERLA